MSTTTLLKTVRAYWEAGLCPLPRVSGHVEPSSIDPHGAITIITWGQYKVQQPAWTTVAAWFAHLTLETAGVVLLTGASPHPGSHHPVLQILDIETSYTWDVHGVPLKTWVPEPGTAWQGTGSACTGRHRQCHWTLLARWEAGEKGSVVAPDRAAPGGQERLLSGGGEAEETIPVSTGPALVALEEQAPRLPGLEVSLAA